MEISERRKIALRAIRRRLDQLAFGVLGREHITDHLVLDETNPQAGDSVARWVKAKRCIPGLLSPQDFEAKFDLEERHTRNLKHFRAGPTEVENAAPTQVEEIFETHYWVVPFDKVPVTSKQATATKSGQQLRTKQSVEVSLTGFDAVIGARFYRVGNHTRVANYVLLLGDSYRGHFYQTHSAIAGNHVRRSKGRQAPRYAMPCVPDLGLQRFFVSPDDPHAAPWRDDPHAAL